MAVPGLLSFVIRHSPGHESSRDVAPPRRAMNGTRAKLHPLPAEVDGSPFISNYLPVMMPWRARAALQNEPPVCGTALLPRRLCC